MRAHRTHHPNCYLNISYGNLEFDLMTRDLLESFRGDTISICICQSVGEGFAGNYGLSCVIVLCSQLYDVKYTHTHEEDCKLRQFRNPWVTLRWINNNKNNDVKYRINFHSHLYTHLSYNTVVCECPGECPGSSPPGAVECVMVSPDFVMQSTLCTAPLYTQHSA